jgi:hydrogenase expression/formation protein HypD
VKRTMAELRDELQRRCERLGRRVQVMEVCGTHTMSVFRHGLRSMLPANLRLVSGPGCPVCVTAQRHIDAAIDLAARRDVWVATYGDMMRVPGRGARKDSRTSNLERVRAEGARVAVVASARTALRLAMEHPDDEVVFLAVGFETTAPATAVTLLEAERRGVENFSVLMCHKLVVPAMRALLEDGECRIDGFLCPGHVSVIIGAEAYRPIVEAYGRPCVVAGFEPEQILAGLVHLVRQIEAGEAALENLYPAAVSDGGNATALRLMERVFEPADTAWRAMGTIPLSGLDLRPRYRRFDALRRFGVEVGEDEDHPACRCGEVIQGKAEPAACPLFGGTCTPLTPVGPCMVSGEGTCAAWYKYGSSELELGVRSEENSCV